MTPKECVLAALRREVPTRIPTFEWFIDDSVSTALCGTADPVEVAARLDLDGVNIRADYEKTWENEQIYTDEWGIRKTLTGDVLPVAVGHPISSVAEQSAYVFPKVDAPHRFRTLERAVAAYGDTRCVVLNLRDGFSDMRDLLGYENALMDMLVDPVNYADLLKRVVDYNLALAELAVRRFGIQVVATTDDVCTAAGPIISPNAYRDVIYPHFAAVMAGFRSLGLKIIKHCDGNVLPFLDLWIAAGIDCLDPIDPGGGLDMADMKAKYGDRLCLKGNIDCTGALCTGTPEEVAEEVRVCIQKGGPGGLILSSSNTIHRGVKPENYRAMLASLRGNEEWKMENGK